jgi:hypothetical protein
VPKGNNKPAARASKVAVLGDHPAAPLNLDNTTEKWRLVFTIQDLRERATARGMGLDAIAAYELVQVGITALWGNRQSVEVVGRVAAFLRGATGPDSDALAILDIARVVALSAWLRKRRDHPPYRPGDAGPYEEAGNDAPRTLWEYLVERYGKDVPSVDDLTDWLDQHAERQARGKLTTAGIVARILNRGKLLGERGSVQKTLERVTKVLARARGRRRGGWVRRTLSTCIASPSMRKAT